MTLFCPNMSLSGIFWPLPSYWATNGQIRSEWFVFFDQNTTFWFIIRLNSIPQILLSNLVYLYKIVVLDRIEISNLFFHIQIRLNEFGKVFCESAWISYNVKILFWVQSHKTQNLLIFHHVNEMRELRMIAMKRNQAKSVTYCKGKIGWGWSWRLKK